MLLYIYMPIQYWILYLHLVVIQLFTVLDIIIYIVSSVWYYYITLFFYYVYTLVPFTCSIILFNYRVASCVLFTYEQSNAQTAAILKDTLILRLWVFWRHWWGKYCEPITLLQKRTMRAICYTKYNAHREPLIKMCNVLKLNDLYATKMLIFYHKLWIITHCLTFFYFKLTISKANERYINRSPKYRLPSLNHE